MEFNIERYIESVEDLDFFEMSRVTKEEIYHMEKVIHPEEGHQKEISDDEMTKAAEYLKELKNLSNFFEQGKIPPEASKKELALLEKISKIIVNRGQFSPSVLDLFK